MPAGFELDQISIEIIDVEGMVTLVAVSTPVGEGRLLGELRFKEKVLYVERAHVEGLAPGVLGRAGINAILRKILVVADVERIVIQGARRTTGRCNGQIPSPIVFPNRSAARFD